MTGLNMTQSSLKMDIQKVISKAQVQLMSEKYGPDYWKYQACLGTHFVAQFYLLARWMKQPLKKFNEATYKSIILSRQQADGSWKQWPDENIKVGDLDATVIHYFALKVMGEDLVSDPMVRARAFILGHGGVEAGTLFIQVIMAMFGNLPWQNIPYIPYLIFIEHMPCNYKSFSHWSKPHVMAFSYLRHQKVSKDLGPLFEVEELKLKPAVRVKADVRLKPTVAIDGAVINKILTQQLHHGSWNGYTTSTLFSIVALSDYESFQPGQNPKIIGGIRRGLEFLEALYIDEGANPYLGVSCDGRNWDTILILAALVDSGKKSSELINELEFTRAVQSSNGGVGYGIDFDVAPDVDDTSEAIKLWATVDKFPSERARAVDWLIRHQNTVGGWGAFDKDNESSPLMKLSTRGFEDSDSLFDFPSADCTGHALEAIGASGFLSKYRPQVKRAVDFLKKRQNSKTGSWEARWAVNHIFGTFVAISGLIKVGENPNAPYLQKALSWMQSIQNEDGGFGESSDSYIDEKWIGKGVSTPSQTAWAMMTLMEFGLAKSAAVAKAAQFLLSEYQESKTWEDPAAVGTGHPGSVYMQYNSYAKAFPLIALAKLAHQL